MSINKMTLEAAFNLLNGRLVLNKAEEHALVVCGGSALIALELVPRTTMDVDVVALMDRDLNLVDPDPLPVALEDAARQVALDLGLPVGFTDRLVRRVHGEKLIVYYSSRLDQIHFKLYAAIDRMGGYHADDLKALDPTGDELLQAACWSMTHDPSGGYKTMMKQFLRILGHEDIAERV